MIFKSKNFQDICNLHGTTDQCHSSGSSTMSACNSGPRWCHMKLHISKHQSWNRHAESWTIHSQLPGTRIHSGKKCQRRPSDSRGSVIHLQHWDFVTSDHWLLLRSLFIKLIKSSKENINKRMPMKITSKYINIWNAQ